MTVPSTTAPTGTEQKKENPPPNEEPSQNVDDEEDDGVDEGTEGPATGDAKKKKKKKKPKKKKVEQSDPPRIGLSKLFPSGVYREVNYSRTRTSESIQGNGMAINAKAFHSNSWRTTSEEKRYLERTQMEDPDLTYNNIRRASEVHRQVRAHARKTIKPGMTMMEIVENIEDGVRALSEETGLDSGIAFPTGVSLNNCAAHYTPNPGDTTVLGEKDVLKVDIGVHVHGRICDSAFTLTFDPTYDRLLEAVQAATETGIREAGIDVRLGDIGAAIQETMESYEVEINGNLIPVKSIENLSGHSITPYSIHGGDHGKSVMLVKNDDPTKMEEGEYFAIETFGSTGRGRAVEGGESSHFAKIPNAPHAPLRLTSAKSLLNTISKTYGTLTFCRRHLHRIGETRHLLGLNHLVAQGIVREYPPLYDQRGSMTAQFEHTILLRPTVKEVVSRGDDY